MDTPDKNVSNTEFSKVFNGEGNIVYYGVHIPVDVQIQDNDEYWQVFEDKTDALKLVKKYKKARFKAFNFYHEAVEFATNGYEQANNMSVDGGFQKTEHVQSVGEKASQFRGPTPQNIVKLRKAMECGDLNLVQKTIWDNPRYLIGAGDTPSILQEGSRYNGLHVSSKSKNGDMCELILNTISNIKFIKKLYVDDKSPEERAKILLDLYLNTPDKGSHETPLHFAVKFGAIKCVEVLVSFSQCDRNLRNKHGKLPSQIICDRYDGPDARNLSDKISALLQYNYYVPVLRSEDNCAPPLIGQPFSPCSPPKLNSDPRSPRLEIHAYAGPMNKEGADKFRKMWKTPPRNGNFGKSVISNRLNKSDSITNMRLRDHEKGLERWGNNLAKTMSVGWKEYWPFLDTFVDITSEEGLRQLENYLADKAANMYRMSPLSSNSLQSPVNESGTNSPPKASCIADISPMTELCRALQTCSIKDNSRRLSNGFDKIQETHSDLSPFFCLDKSLQVFAKRISNDILHLLNVQYDTCKVIETQVKQLQLLMLSYMDDNRFRCIDFQLVHSRLSYLIKMILKQNLKKFTLLENMLDLWMEFCSKNYDCFSSDDEGVQNTVVHMKNQHSMCILKHVQEFISKDYMMDEVESEEDCVKIWKEMKPCSCAWKNKGHRKNHGNKRTNSLKFRNPFKQEYSRKLFQEDNTALSISNQKVASSESSSSDDEYFTPPSSPSLLDNKSDDDENYYETHLPDIEIFIEGDFPTKVDAAVYNALNYVECKLNYKDYPNICNWQNAVSQYKESERNNWGNVSVAKCKLDMNTSLMLTSTPIKSTFCKTTMDSSPPYTPPKSWLRITGANSPRVSIKNQQGNVSFNL